MILQELRDHIQQGVAVSYTDLVVSNVPIMRIFDPPMFSLQLTNNGPGTVQYRLPSGTAANWIDIVATQVIVVNLAKAKISGVDYRVVAGAGGTIVAFGIY